MKVILQDGKTEFNHVNRVDERIDIVDREEIKTLIIQIDMSVSGSITGNDAVDYYKTVGMDRITVVGKNDIALKTYEGFSVLSSVYTTYSERAQYLNLTLKQRE